MTTRAQCPRCGYWIDSGDGAAGREVICPCGQWFRLTDDGRTVPMEMGRVMLSIARVPSGAPFVLHVHRGKYPKLQEALEALANERLEAGRYGMITRDEWLAHAAEFYDWHVSLRG